MCAVQAVDRHQCIKWLPAQASHAGLQFKRRTVEKTVYFDLPLIYGENTISHGVIDASKGRRAQRTHVPELVGCAMQAVEQQQCVKSLPTKVSD